MTERLRNNFRPRVSGEHPNFAPADLHFGIQITATLCVFLWMSHFVIQSPITGRHSWNRLKHPCSPPSSMSLSTGPQAHFSKAEAWLALIRGSEFPCTIRHGAFMRPWRGARESWELRLARSPVEIPNAFSRVIWAGGGKAETIWASKKPLTLMQASILGSQAAARQARWPPSPRPKQPIEATPTRGSFRKKSITLETAFSKPALIEVVQWISPWPGPSK